MRNPNLAELESLVAAAGRNSAVAGQIRGVALEVDQDEFGGDYLRVVFSMDRIEKVKDEEMLSLMASVRDAIGDVDRRLPVVLFDDAA